jgi:hypothetical protein
VVAVGSDVCVASTLPSAPADGLLSAPPAKAAPAMRRTTTADAATLRPIKV